MSRTVKIYGWIDPRNRKLMYVGSAFNPLIRYFCGHQECQAWVKELAELGLVPEVVLLSEVPEQFRLDIELEWIRFISKQYKLHNKAGVVATFEWIETESLNDGRVQLTRNELLSSGMLCLIFSLIQLLYNPATWLSGVGVMLFAVAFTAIVGAGYKVFEEVKAYG